MKIYVLLSTCLLFVNCYSQSLSGKVNYKIKSIDFETKSIDNPKMNQVVGEAKTIAENQSFTLEFNKTRSKFVLNQVMNRDEPRQKILDKIASLIFTSSFNYYLDKNLNMTLFQKNNGVLIKGKYKKKDWKISTQSKKIGDYLCYKAIYTKNIIDNNKKKKSIPVVAWFAPSLPYTYGPKDYSDLPGLILELEENETTYYAVDIKISQKNELKIDFPKGKTITQEEYEIATEKNLDGIGRR